MENKPRLLKALGVVALIGGIVLHALGNRLNSNQVLGCLVAGGFMFIVSLVAFLFGALPFRAAGAGDKTIARAFIFACVALFYSACQIPLWCLLTHQFPPGDMSGGQAGWVTAGVVFALFGPAAPWAVGFFRFLQARNKDQRDALERKKTERE